MGDRQMRHQHWMFLGNSPASARVWGIERIDFPCAYLIPDIAVVGSEHPLIWPGAVDTSMILGGVAVEIARECSNIESSEAESYIAGFHLWGGLHCNFLTEALAAQEHTITMWDRGVSVFYGAVVGVDSNIWRVDLAR